MRSIGLLGIGIFAMAALFSASCTLKDFCNEGLCRASGAGAQSSGASSGTGGMSASASSSSTGSSSSGTAGSGGGTPNCDPTKGGVDDGCGVFVSSSKGKPGNPGSKGKPMASLTEAIASSPMAIYACGEAFAEAVILNEGIALYGALDCTKADWAYDAKKLSVVNAPADQVALTVGPTADGAKVYDFHLESADAKTPGGSSVAVLLDAVMVTLERVELVAGKGGDGAAGAAQLQVSPGANGKAPALTGCQAAMGVFGGGGGQLACQGTDVSGGDGGDGKSSMAAGGTGSDGSPLGAMGKGGVGQTMALPCDAGTKGANGLAGTSGQGATGIGTLKAIGYQPPQPTAGATSGTPGQGGGGGGGAKQCMANVAGPAGGGGGSGGCGGAPGNAGQSAGGSFALLSVNATTTLKNAKLTAKAGGQGGAGGDGQPGAAGGQPGASGGANACVGGGGGQGGRGGSGGGGLGGHSIALAFIGTMPEQTNVTLTANQPGPGGNGGDMDVGAKGADGIACKSLDFANAMSCK